MFCSRMLPVAGLFLLACLPPNLEASELKIAAVAPEGSSWMKDLRAAGLQIRDRTGGRVNLKFYGGGIQGNDKKVLRKIRIGQLQGGVFTPNGLEERYPDILLYGLPMLFNSQDEVDYVRQRMDAKLAAGLKRAGLVSYGFAGGGFAYFLTGKPVTGLADLRGQKIWVPEGDETSYVAMQALRLTPVILPITDVLTGLQTGLLDIVAAPPVGAVVLQWYTKTRYVTTQPLSYTMGLLVIDQRALATVTAADQEVLREVLSAVYARFDVQNRIDNTKAEAALKANGLTFVAPDVTEIPEWRAAISTAIDGMVAKGAISSGLLAEVNQHLKDYRQGAHTDAAPEYRP
ncbi:MAG: TRAP transporter substrate-binding protein DctP [Gammaproteobacteria bacterium]|nr:TRAP transporter substrate-binding protein DctP [Gammaproteobacteria bacterium]